MKKALLVISVILFFQNANYAQDRYRLGLSLGPNYTSLRGSDFLESTTPGFGFLTGLSIEYNINKSLSISTGFNFEQKSIKDERDYRISVFDEWNYASRTETINAKTNNKFQYFSLPVFFKYNFGKSNSFYLSAGAYISFLQKHKKESKFVNKDRGSLVWPGSDYKYNFPMADEISGDYGVSIGIGKSFEIDVKNKISIELRDNIGLKNTIENQMNYGLSGVIKTNTLNLIANWSFSL